MRLIELDREILRAAAQLEPPEVRSLDAIHVASALAVADELGALFTYDRQVVQAARAAGLAVESPA